MVFREGDRTLDVYPPSLTMSTYTVAFVMCDFEKVSSEDSRVSTWSRRDLSGYMEESTKIGESALRFLEGFTNIKYSTPKMNFAAIPGIDNWIVAMENWGLVTFMYVPSRFSFTD